jgi:hypothetical protein
MNQLHIEQPLKMLEKVLPFLSFPGPSRRPGQCFHFQCNQPGKHNKVNRQGLLKIFLLIAIFFHNVKPKSYSNKV